MSIKAKTISIDGSALDRDGSSGIFITLQDWQKLATSDNSDDRVGQHGRIVSPTYSRIRTITIEGVIDRVGNANEFQAVQYLEKLLCIQSDPSTLIPRIFSIKDAYDREWTLSVKVKEPIEMMEWDTSMPGSHWSWRCVLESIGDPSFLQKDEQNIVSAEGAFGWFTIPFMIPFMMNGTRNTITVVPTGNGIIRPRIVITVTNTIDTPIKIINATSGEIFSLGVNWVAWDIITIDSTTRKCFKNGSDITALRIPGSIFPKITGWQTTIFRVEDADGGIFESDFSVTFYFRNTLS